MRTAARSSLLAVLSLLLTLHTSALQQAHAQASPPPTAAADVEAIIASPEYKHLITEGMLKYTRGFWSEALAFFLKAHELAPNARTLRGLALVSYDSHHYIDAMDYAEQALTHPVQPLNDKMGEELKQLEQQARGLVARVQLVTKPSAAELRVDGKPTVTRADGNVWTDPGPHYLSVSANGFATETRHLQLAEGTLTRVDIALVARAIATPTALAASRPRKAKPAGGSALPWIVVGVSAALAAVGGVLIAVDQSAGPTGKTPAGAVMLGVGGVGVAAGLTWSFWPQPQPERAPAAQLRLGPASVQLRGSF